MKPATRALTEAEQARLARHFFARQIAVGAGAQPGSRLEAAFARVPREHFLDSAPWRISYGRDHAVVLAQNDPVVVYQDVMVEVQAARGINNGTPSLHARMLRHLSVRPGQHVVHLGAGAGYYSAVLAELTGPTGSVLAVEYDAELAVRAARNLAPWPQVRVVQGDALAMPPTDVDRIYVSFAVSRPAAPWLDRLRTGGRLLFPLSVPDPNLRRGVRRSAVGVALLVGNTGKGYAAQATIPVWFVWGAGEATGQGEAQTQLAAAFARGGASRVRSLIWRQPADPATSWFRDEDWALSFDPPPG